MAVKRTEPNGGVRDVLRVAECTCGRSHVKVPAIPLPTAVFVPDHARSGAEGARSGRFYTHTFECPITGESVYARRLP